MIEVVCGDCLDYIKSMDSLSVDLIVTDPPYEIDDLTEFFNEFKRLLKPTGSLYVFGNKNKIAEKWFSQLVMPNKELLIWHYKNSPKALGRWRISMQAIIYAYFSKDSTFNQDEVRVEYLESTKKLNGRKRPSPGRLTDCKPYDTSKGALPRDVIEVPALTGHLSKERIGHPDQKPLELIKKLVLASSNSGDLVLDAFAGSGTTGLACNNRNCILVEQDHFWHSKIKERLTDNNIAFIEKTI